MKLNRGIQTKADFEIGEDNIIETFLHNIKNLDPIDAQEVLYHVVMGKPTYSALEYLSVVNGVIEKLKK